MIDQHAAFLQELARMKPFLHVVNMRDERMSLRLATGILRRACIGRNP